MTSLLATCRRFRGVLAATLVAAGVSGLVFLQSAVPAALACGGAEEAACGPEYSKLTEGITGELDVIVPIVLVALGTVMGISFAIKWASKRFGGAK